MASWNNLAGDLYDLIRWSPRYRSDLLEVAPSPGEGDEALAQLIAARKITTSGRHQRFGLSQARQLSDADLLTVAQWVADYDPWGHLAIRFRDAERRLRAPGDRRHADAHAAGRCPSGSAPGLGLTRKPGATVTRPSSGRRRRWDCGRTRAPAERETA